MTFQFLADGLIAGALIGLGAIGVTLTYSILRFANFAHGEFVSFGAYATLLLAAVIGSIFAGADQSIGPFSFGWGVIIAGVAAMALTGALALGLDYLLFGRLRDKGAAITTVMASFGASMALRSLLEFAFTSRPVYFQPRSADRLADRARYPRDAGPDRVARNHRRADDRRASIVDPHPDRARHARGQRKPRAGAGRRRRCGRG